MDAILDGSFMLNAMRKNIDFVEQLQSLGFTPVMPREVMQELKDVRTKAKTVEKMKIDSLFELLEKRDIKKIGIGAGRIDEQLIKLGNQGKYIATMDAALRRAVPNRLIISDAQKKVIVDRD